MSASMLNIVSIEQVASRLSIALSSTNCFSDQITEPGPIDSDGLTYSLVNRNLVNPALASENTCSICAHKNNGCCKEENVP
ncbi:hypothetical protein PENANT_c036G06241 [Penicillium antarcticum]|uniref:Uncharacterized protein n=1 Tax=Penicillium antarcticum TaxID=416450 RepID=A0A1V6PTZ3_9EURO|nr:hypothetical protein PENANT_c036G06241 [Penicillium antarcticum]